tara:strand:- start:420 stop:1100 length:681 start_codon:yes stop_codon:yes gene_type:complete
MSKSIIILQARTSSKRLPGKVLKKINGIPLVVLCAKRLQNRGDNLIVATSNEKSDDKLVKVLINEKINYFRGDLKNVFSRYLTISKKYNNNDLILRATADNPLPDGNLVDTVIKHFNSIRNDYFGIDHTLHNLPHGISLEIFYAKKIIKTGKMVLSADDKEHVTLKMYKNIKIPNLLIKSIKIKNNLSNVNYSVDEKKDLLKVRKLFKKVKNPIKISLKKLLKRTI